MISIIKKSIVSGIKRFGYNFIPEYRIHNYAMASHLKYVFETLDVDIVLDVGANQGQYHDFLRDEVGYRGTIVSFEPIPELFQALQTKAQVDDRQQVENIALGAVEGELPFNVMNTTEFSSFLTPTHEHTSRFTKSNAVARTIVVKVKTLNGIMPRLPAQYRPRGIYLKIDTQGFDRQVIEGGSDVLGAVEALQTEMSVTQIYEGMSDYRDMLGFLQAQGFSPSGFFPVNSINLLRMIEFDACMINNKFLYRVATSLRRIFELDILRVGGLMNRKWVRRHLRVRQSQSLGLWAW